MAPGEIYKIKPIIMRKDKRIADDQRKEKQIKDELNDMKELLIANLSVFSGILIAIGLRVFTSKDPEWYKTSNQLLLTITIIVFFNFLLYATKFNLIYTKAKKIFRKECKIGIGDYADAVAFVSFLLLGGAAIFLLDAKAIKLKNYRIGTVVAVGLLNVLGSFITIIKAKWRAWRNRN